MKKVLITTIIIASFSVFSSALAQPNFSTTNVPNIEVYPEDKDVLVLDFIIDPGNEAMTFEEMTMTQSGSVLYNREYVSITLWQDSGPAGFDGWGYDEVLTVGPSSLIFSNINASIDVATRFFISIDIGVTPQAQTFSATASEIVIDGVSYTNVSNLQSALVLVRTTNVDVRSPQAFVENLDIAQENYWIIQPNEEQTLFGEARDRGRGNVQYVNLIMGGTEIATTNIGDNYSQWQAKYTPSSLLENLSVLVEAGDTLSQIYEGPIYSLVLDARQPDISTTTFVTDNSFIMADGEDSATLLLSLKDQNGDPLPHREILFASSRDLDTVTALSLTTNADGEVNVAVASVSPGSSTIYARLNGEVVASMPMNFLSEEEPVPVQGRLVRGSLPGVYYVDGAGVRHVFVHSNVFFTWYDDFSAVETVSDTEMASIPLGGPVTFRPGTLVTAPSVNEVYLVDINQTFRHLGSEAVAIELFGSGWNSMIFDMQESLLFSYNFGEVINQASDINLAELENLTLFIDSEVR